MARTYDQKCFDLAARFLENEPHLDSDEAVHELACDIQQAIEDWLAEKNRNYEPKETSDAWSGGFAGNH